MSNNLEKYKDQTSKIQRPILAIKDEESQKEIGRLLRIHERNKAFLTELNNEIDLYQRRNAIKNSKRQIIIIKAGPDFRLNLIHRQGDSMLFEYFKGTRDLSYTYVRVKDASSGKYHFLSVPNGITTCQKAIAWTFGMNSSEYCPSVET